MILRGVIAAQEFLALLEGERNLSEKPTHFYFVFLSFTCAFGRYCGVEKSVSRQSHKLKNVRAELTAASSDECEHRDSCYNRYGRSRKVPVICPVGVEVAYRSQA